MIHSNTDREGYVDTAGAYRSLAAAVVLQAVTDWEHLCRMCGKGKPYYYKDCNFPELERFFDEDADFYSDASGVTTDKMLSLLQAKKDAALIQRQKLIESGKVHDFGTWLFAARKAKGINRRVFAERLGVPYKTIAKIESGEYIPNKTMKAKITALLCRW